MELSSCSVPASINDENLETWKHIGRGGFGEIYRAKHNKWGTNVAIKLLRYNDGSDSSLLQEADLMRHGGNPNVLRIFGVYVGSCGGQSHPSQLGLVMEYMERGSVKDLLEALGGPPPWPLAFRITHQIALGMNFLHQLSPPLLHLDLKPSNVLLDDSLNAKLTDFGLAKLARTSSVGKEQDEEVAGTTSYMPPEAFQPSYTPTFSSDIYSYGVLLWSVITGMEPYHTPFSSLVRFRVTEGDRPDLSSVDSSQAHGLSDLIDLMKDCWHADYNKRPVFMKCVNVTEKVYDLHKRQVFSAVVDAQETLDTSSFNSLRITPNNASVKEKHQHSVKTGPTPTQENFGITTSRAIGTVSLDHPRPSPPSRTNPKTAAKGPHTNHKPAAKGPHTRQNFLTQRQYSTPGTVSICLSNVTGVQIGDNNYMNIRGSREIRRQRHPTAPSSVSLSNSDQPLRHQRKHDHVKP